MIITDQQIMQLLTVLYDSIRSRISIEGMFGLSLDLRTRLYETIMNQQSHEKKVIE